MSRSSSSRAIIPPPRESLRRSIPSPPSSSSSSSQSSSSSSPSSSSSSSSSPPFPVLLPSHQYCFQLLISNGAVPEYVLASHLPPSSSSLSPLSHFKDSLLPYLRFLNYDLIPFLHDGDHSPYWSLIDMTVDDTVSAASFPPLPAFFKAPSTVTSSLISRFPHHLFIYLLYNIISTPMGRLHIPSFLPRFLSFSRQMKKTTTLQYVEDFIKQMIMGGVIEYYFGTMAKEFAGEGSQGESQMIHTQKRGGRSEENDDDEGHDGNDNNDNDDDENGKVRMGSRRVSRRQSKINNGDDSNAIDYSSDSHFVILSPSSFSQLRIPFQSQINLPISQRALPFINSKNCSVCKLLCVVGFQCEMMREEGGEINLNVDEEGNNKPRNNANCSAKCHIECGKQKWKGTHPCCLDCQREWKLSLWKYKRDGDEGRFDPSNEEIEAAKEEEKKESEAEGQGVEENAREGKEQKQETKQKKNTKSQIPAVAVAKENPKGKGKAKAKGKSKGKKKRNDYEDDDDEEEEEEEEDEELDVDVDDDDDDDDDDDVIDLEDGEDTDDGNEQKDSSPKKRKFVGKKSQKFDEKEEDESNNHQKGNGSHPKKNRKSDENKRIPVEEEEDQDQDTSLVIEDDEEDEDEEEEMIKKNSSASSRRTNPGRSSRSSKKMIDDNEEEEEADEEEEVAVEDEEEGEDD